MTICNHCKKKIDGLPHACKYCGEYHCSNHLLPENHNCKELKEYSSKNAEKWKKNFSEIISPKVHKVKKSQVRHKDKNYAKKKKG